MSENRWRLMYYNCGDMSDNLYLIICYFKTISSFDDDGREYVPWMPASDLWWQSGELLSEKQIQRAIREGKDFKVDKEHSLIELVDNKYYINDLKVNREKIDLNVLKNLIANSGNKVQEIKVYIYCHMMWRLSEQGAKYKPEITTVNIAGHIYGDINLKGSKAKKITDAVIGLRDMGYLNWFEKQGGKTKYKKMVFLKTSDRLKKETGESVRPLIFCAGERRTWEGVAEWIEKSRNEVGRYREVIDGIFDMSSNEGLWEIYKNDVEEWLKRVGA